MLLLTSWKDPSSFSPSAILLVHGRNGKGSERVRLFARKVASLCMLVNHLPTHL